MNLARWYSVEGEMHKMSMIDDTVRTSLFDRYSSRVDAIEVECTRLGLVIGMRCVKHSISQTISSASILHIDPLEVFEQSLDMQGPFPFSFNVSYNLDLR